VAELTLSGIVAAQGVAHEFSISRTHTRGNLPQSPSQVKCTGAPRYEALKLLHLHTPRDRVEKISAFGMGTQQTAKPPSINHAMMLWQN
jgi:hypothetical protein